MTQQSEHWVHWLILRQAIVRMCLVFSLLFIGCWIESNLLYGWLEAPLLAVLPAHQLISTSLTDTMLMPLQLSLWTAMGLSIPYIFYELWRFITPAMRAPERWLWWPILVASWGLFILGGFFAYKVVFPIAFACFVHLAPPGILVMPDMMRYLDLCGALIMAFGCAAQLPLVMAVLSLLGLVSAAVWVYYRPYAIVSAFVIGMLLTPPDVVSQVLLAVPLCVLYSLGIAAARWIERRRQRQAG